MKRTTALGDPSAAELSSQPTRLNLSDSVRTYTARRVSNPGSLPIVFNSNKPLVIELLIGNWSKNQRDAPPMTSQISGSRGWRFARRLLVITPAATDAPTCFPTPCRDWLAALS